LSKRGYSDKYMQNLWRQAVRTRWGHRCAQCGRPNIECHHVVKRKRGTLRHDAHNGIALCPVCHKWADTAEGREWVESVMDMDHLREWDRNIKEVLMELGLSRREYDQQQAEKLKNMIEGDVYAK